MRQLRGITVQQPHAWALVHGDKPFENRTWHSDYRGPVLIHAGRGRDWLDPDQDPDDPADRAYTGCPADRDLVFGSIIGIVDMVACYKVGELPPLDLQHWTATGPYCHHYQNPRPLPEPIKATGLLSYWLAPDWLEAEVRRQLGRKVVARGR